MSSPAGTLPFGLSLRSVLPETSCKLPPLAFAPPVVSNAVGIAAAPLGGWLADRAGRRANDMATDRRAAAASYHADRGLDRNVNAVNSSRYPETLLRTALQCCLVSIQILRELNEADC